MATAQLDSRSSITDNLPRLIAMGFFGIVGIALFLYLLSPIIDGGLRLFLQRLFDGLDNGAVYAVVAVALVLIFKATTLINFAQGELAMFGTFIAYLIAVPPEDSLLSYTLGWADLSVGFLPLGLMLSIVVAMAISAAAGATIERVLIRPFDPTDHLPVVLITLGIFLILNAVAGYLWNYNPRAFPSMFPNGSDDFIGIGGARLRYTVVGTWAVLGLMFLSLWFILGKTKAGLAFRAVSS
ncbi:MAG: hypothetical protein AAFN30_07925, partial [Actinomycetota bacterium]